MVTAIVGCSKAKIDTDEPVPASELYDSTYFDKRWNVASEYDDVWILSAEYGLIRGDKEIPKYDTVMGELSDNERDDIISQISSKGLSGTVEVYAGKDYVNAVRDAVDDGVNVNKPLSGGIGKQLGQLKQLEDSDEKPYIDSDPQ